MIHYYKNNNESLNYIKSKSEIQKDFKKVDVNISPMD